MHTCDEATVSIKLTTSDRVCWTYPRNNGPPVSAIRARACRDQTWTAGELTSCARACRIPTLVVKWWPELIPPVYRCKHPKTSEWPVRDTASRAVFSVSKQYWTVLPMNLLSSTTCAMRPRAHQRHIAAWHHYWQEHPLHTNSRHKMKKRIQKTWKSRIKWE